MTEKGPINDGLTKHEACDGSLGWEPSLKHIELTERMSLFQPVEICAGCGVEKEPTPEQLKWVWHKENCDNPGNLTLLLSSHAFSSHALKEMAGGKHWYIVDVECENCQQSVQIKTDLRECWCLEPQF